MNQLSTIEFPHTRHRSATLQRPVYRSRIVPTASLDAAQVAEMSALYLDNYAGSDDELFRADLFEKDVVLQVLHDDMLVGFTTLLHYEVEWRGQRTGVVFSGDTIVAPRHWGQRELAFAWLRHVGRIKAAAPDQPLYWFLLVKGHRTYRYLSVFAQHFHPCVETVDSGVENELKALADFLASARYGEDYNPQTGVIEFAESRGYLRPAIATPDEDELAREDVCFFLNHNPGYLRGNELVCVCELSVENLKPLAARYFLRAQA